MVWITLTEWRVRQPHRKDATNEKKFVLLDSGTEHHGSSESHPFTMVLTVWYDRVVPHASGCVAGRKGGLSDERKSNLVTFPQCFPSWEGSLSFLKSKLTNKRVDGMREMRVDRLQA